MATYRKSDPEVSALVADVMQTTYPELVESGVTVECQYARADRKANGELKGPALTAGGFQVLTKVRINNQPDRAQGLCDCRVVVDEDEWETLPDERRRAEIDAALQRVELQLDDDARVKSDDCGRPMLRLRKPDWSVSGFNAVANRHRENAPEWRALEEAKRQLATWAPETTEAGQ